MEFKKWLNENELDFDDSLFAQKEKTQKSNVSKILGFSKPLKKIAEGSFATLYQHPNHPDKLIKITSHKEDVDNIVKAQRIGSNNIAKVFDWVKGNKIKTIPKLKSYAIIVEKINGKPMQYSTGHFLQLADMGGGIDFDSAADWLDYQPKNHQAKILNMYNANTPKEHDKLSELFRTLNELEKYRIELSDFDQNIIDAGDRYVIVDLGF